jgi:hypothetical protein
MLAVTSLKGVSLPLNCITCMAICTNPEQHGTFMCTIVMCNALHPGMVQNIGQLLQMCLEVIQFKKSRQLYSGVDN